MFIISGKTCCVAFGGQNNLGETFTIITPTDSGFLPENPLSTYFM